VGQLGVVDSRQNSGGEGHENQLLTSRGLKQTDCNCEVNGALNFVTALVSDTLAIAELLVTFATGTLVSLMHLRSSDLLLRTGGLLVFC